MKPHIEVMRDLVARHDRLEALRARHAADAQRVIDGFAAPPTPAVVLAAPPATPGNITAAPAPAPAPHDDVRQRGAPEACALPDGRIALFIGGGYRYLARAEALAYARSLVDCVLETARRERATRADDVASECKRIDAEPRP